MPELDIEPARPPEPAPPRDGLTRLVAAGCGLSISLAAVGLAGSGTFRGTLLTVAFLLLTATAVIYWLMNLFGALSHHTNSPLLRLPAYTFAVWIVMYVTIIEFLLYFELRGFLITGDVGRVVGYTGPVRDLGWALSGFFFLYTAIAATVLWRAMPGHVALRAIAVVAFVPAWTAVHARMLSPFGEAFDLNVDVLRDGASQHLHAATASLAILIAAGLVLGLATLGIRRLRGAPSRAAGAPLAQRRGRIGWYAWLVPGIGALVIDLLVRGPAFQLAMVILPVALGIVVVVGLASLAARRSAVHPQPAGGPPPGPHGERDRNAARHRLGLATLAVIVIVGGPLLFGLTLGLHPNDAMNYQQQCRITHKCLD